MFDYYLSFFLSESDTYIGTAHFMHSFICSSEVVQNFLSQSNMSLTVSTDKKLLEV